MYPAYLYQQDESNPRTSNADNNANWQGQAGAVSVMMNRNRSNDTTSSTRTRYSNENYSSISSPATTVLSFGDGSPFRHDNDNFSAPQYASYVGSSPPIQPSDSNQTNSPRMTPTALGWLSDTSLLQYYKFVVNKGKEPYFDLLPDYTATSQAPSRVYLDPPPRYAVLYLTRAPC